MQTLFIQMTYPKSFFSLSTDICYHSPGFCGLDSEGKVRLR